MSNTHKAATAAALVGSFAAIALAVVAALLASDYGEPEPATRSDVAKVKEQLASIDRQLREVTDATANSTSDVSGVAGDVQVLHSSIKDLKDRLAEKGTTINQLNGAVATLQDQIEPVESFVRKQGDSKSSTR